MKKVERLKQSLNVHEWTLHPFERFGPVSLVGLDETTLVETFGEPMRVDTHYAGRQLVFYHQNQGAMLAWIPPDTNEVCYLTVAVGFHLQTPLERLAVPALTETDEEIRQWLDTHDVLLRNHNSDVPHLFTAPLLGMMWDMKERRFIISCATQHVHVLLYENYSAAPLEFLGDDNFVAQLKALKQLKPDFFTPSWSPITLAKKLAGKGLPFTQYGGTPVLAASEKPPVCGCCGAILPLNIQINLEYVPAAVQARIGNSGILQLFYCREEACQNNFDLSDAKNSKPYICRILTAEQMQPWDGKLDARRKFKKLPERAIAGWFYEEFDAPPLENLLEELSAEQIPAMIDEDDFECYQYYFPYVTDKLCGVPSWDLQANESLPYHSQCPICRSKKKQSMQLLFQYRSEKKNGFEFFDAGVIFILQCTKHKDQLGLFMSSC